jgi:hypothetical protein
MRRKRPAGVADGYETPPPVHNDNSNPVPARLHVNNYSYAAPSESEAICTADLETGL